MAAGYMRKYRKKSSAARRKRAANRKKNLSKRVAAIENNFEKKYDIFLLSNVGEPNVANSQEMTNNLGGAAGGYLSQIRDISPLVNQTTTDVGRVGDEIIMKSMDFRAVVSYQPNASLPAAGKIGVGDVAHCRVMLVWDNDPTKQGVTPASGAALIEDNPLSWNHVLAEKPDATETPALSLAAYNHDIVTRDKRISVLIDKRFDMVAGTDRTVMRFNLKKFYKGLKLKYHAGDNTILNKQLKLLFLSNRVTTEAPHLYCENKVIYIDP